MDATLNELIRQIQDSQNIVFFGGAGVSTESGIKDFRSEDGLYNTVKHYRVSPETILSHHFFMEDPKTFYDFFREYFMESVSPNAAHIALVHLEKIGKLKAVVTQNVDGLHQKAGSQTVWEVHGNVRDFYCTRCRKDAPDALTQIKKGGVPRCEYCGGLVRPDIVLYEEALNDKIVEGAINAISKADMLIVGGSSMTVYPANSFVHYFKGDRIVMINKSTTPFDHHASYVIRDSIGRVLQSAVEALF